VVFTRAALDEFVSNASRGISVKVALAVDADGADAPSGRHAAPDSDDEAGAITLTKASSSEATGTVAAATDTTEEDAK